jgi:hypothetical protein
MKNIMTIKNCGAAMLVLLLAVTGCVKDKSKEVAQEQSQFNNNSQVQFYNAIVAAARNFVYVDAVPVTGASLALGGTFPSTPASFSITSGFRAFLIRDTLSTTTQPAISFGENLQPSGFYTIFLYDTVTQPKQKTVWNNIVIPSDTTSRLRFANFIYNPSALSQGFDIFSVKRNAVIFSNVRETEVTEFIPYASALTDTFYIRLNGSSANLQNTDTTGKPTILNVQAVLTPTRLRSYTLVWRGGYRTSVNKSTTGAALASARQLSVFANY